MERKGLPAAAGPVRSRESPKNEISTRALEKKTPGPIS